MRLLSDVNLNMLRFGFTAPSLSTDIGGPDGAKERTEGADWLETGEARE